jgi:signal transduction histidine kinase
MLVQLLQGPGVAWFATLGAGVAFAALWFPNSLLPGAAFALLFAAAAGVSLRAWPGGRGDRVFLWAAAGFIPAAMYWGGEWARLVMRALPLGLLLVDTYTRRRFLFVDVFLKWGLAFFVAVGCFALWFRLAPRDLALVWQAVACTLLAGAIARAARCMFGFIDRRLLGRPATPAEAGERFAQALRGATDEAAALAVAERELSILFRAEARIRNEAPEGQEVCPVPVQPPLWVDLRRPEPIFSEDLALLRSLCRTLGLVLEQRRLEAASARAELRALRAQINPHFLFNALNTAAALIPTRPGLAERTLERLSDVFRYTLRRSETEWTTLREEMEFVRAWLEVEQARFGNRLEVDLEVDVEAACVRLPAMVVQPLVENAIRHGAARQGEVCRIRLLARRRPDRVIVEVRDTGPGPEPGWRPGHGLENVWRRLEGYYGGSAQFRLEREAFAGETVARLEGPA